MALHFSLSHAGRVHPAGQRRRFGLSLAPWFALLVFGFCLPGAAWAASALDEWRGEAGRTRILAENDPPRAYQEAQRLQASLPADAAPADRARVLNLLSRIEVYLALTEPAAKHAQLALDLASQNEDRVGQAEAQLNIGWNAINQARIDASFDAARRSMELLEGVNRPDLLGESLLRVSMMYRRQGNLDNSVTMAMQSMEIAKRSNDPHALAYAHQGMAISYDQSYRSAEAREHYLQMRIQASAAHSKILEGHAIRGLAGIAVSLGDAVGGERLMREAVALLRPLRTPFILNHALFGLADLIHKQGRHAEAVLILDEVIAIYERYPNKIGLWWSLNARSENHQSLRNISAARADAERAYALAKDIDFPLYKSESAKRMAAIVAATGDHRRAYQLSVEASGMADKAARERASTRMVELAQRYVTESKQREINELIRRYEQQTAELRQHALQQRWLWTVLGASLALLAGTAYFLLRLRRSQRVQEVLNTQVTRSKMQLQATLDAIPDALFVVGLDGRYHDFHSPRVDCLVVPVEVFIGKTISDILPPEAAATCMSALREAHEKGVSTGKQIELMLVHGKSWFELSVSRKPVDAGQEPRFIVLSRDITERKEAEMALYASEQAIRAVVENSPDYIARYDNQCRRIYVNPIVQELFALPLEEILGKTPAEPSPSPSPLPDAQAFTQMIRKVLESGQTAQWDTLFHTAQGEARWGHLRLAPEFGPDGVVASVLAVGRDVSSLKKTELHLEEARTRLHSVLQTIPDLVWLKDTEGVYLACNHAFERLFGAKEADIIGKTDHDFVDAELADSFRQKDREALAAGCTCVNEQWVTFAQDKSRVLLETRKVPVHGADGKVLGVLGISRDITERKRMVRHLEESQQLLRQLAARNEATREDERKRLAREIHDELGQYLMALRMGVSVVDLQFGANNPLLHEKTQRLIEMVNSTIKVVRNVVASLRPTALDMGIVSALEWLAVEYFGQTGIQCELHVSEEEIFLDDTFATAIFRIVQESLTNIVRHAKANKVEIRLERNGANYLLEVRDDGRGFDPAIRKEKSFGLVGIRERALMLGGKVDISSAPGRATAIRVHIPINNVLTN